MTEQAPVDPSLPQAPTPSQTASAAEPSVTSPAPTINIGDEFGTAKRNLPPAKIVLIGIAVVLVVGAIVIFVQSRSSSSGSIDDISAVEVPDQNSSLVAINVSLQNNGNKAIWIHTIQAVLKTPDGKEYKDEAASPVDFERYFQALPALKQHALTPLAVETKLQPGQQAKGTIVVSFPVSETIFSDKRNELSVSIQPYDERPVILKK